MSTPFKKIYDTLELIKNDSRLNNKPTNLLYQTYYKYLDVSIGIFFRECYKDLTQQTPFQQIEYGFVSDGSSNTFILNNPSTPFIDGLLYIGYSKDLNTNPTEITTANYSYDSNTNTITINGITIPSGNILYAASYKIGEFNEILDYDERLILAEGMNIPFLEEKQNTNSQLTQRVWGAQQNQSSQGEHIKQVNNVVETQRKRVDNLINKYTYLANPNKSKGLGGGLI